MVNIRYESGLDRRAGDVFLRIFHRLDQIRPHNTGAVPQEQRGMVAVAPGLEC